MCTAVDNADVLETIAFNDSLLREHIKSGKNSEALSLLEGADPCHFVAKHKSTLLHLATEYGNKDLARYLLDLGADVDAKNNIGETPLTIAVKHEYKDLIKILLQANADICVRDIFGKCTLERAFEEMEGIREDVRRLILDRVTIDFVLESLRTKGRAFHDEFPLYNFPLLKNAELTKVLLDNGSPIEAAHDSTRRTALHEAVRHLAVDNVKLLLKYRANVDARDERNSRPLALIPDFNDDDGTLEIVKILINAGASLINENELETLMQSMLSNGGRKLIHTVLQSPTDLFVMNRRRRMPIDYIFENRDPAVYRELRKSDIDFKMCFDDNKTLLHRVADKGNPFAVKFLIDRGVDVNAKDGDNLTPLHVAIDPIASAEKRQRVDHWMCDIGNCIRVLLHRGADPQVFARDIDRERISAFDDESVAKVANELMRPVLVQLALQEAGGRVIDEFMLSEIRLRAGFRSILDSCRRELEAMKGVELDESVTLFDFLAGERIRMFAENDALVANLTEVMNGYDVEWYYYERLKNRLWKLGRLFAVNEVFVQSYNVSAMGIAEKIVGYL